jgi:hypothetical protein
MESPKLATDNRFKKPPMKLSIKKIHLVMCAILIMNTIDCGFFVLEITSSKDAGSYFFSHRKSKHSK